MATLVLSTVGNALGGPVGSAIGALIGQSIDQQLFGSGPRQGPRLNDLAVQTSSYGTQIPRVYGRMRVAGSVIWATDLRESSTVQSGGKGQPDVETYGYSVSLAVALSSREAAGIGRIWADGKLIRGEAGDFKVRTTFRFRPGDEDDAIDPLIASAEGIESTPAYRGLALAVFEDLDLSDFGNRIPFLTFELLGDQGAVALGLILSDSTGGIIASGLNRPIAGYAAHGPSQASAIAPLIDHLGIDLSDRDGHLESAVPILFTPDERDLGCAADGKAEPISERSMVPEGSTPASLTIDYYEPARDYQVSRMQAFAGSRRGTADEVDLPLVLSAAEARGLAEDSLARRWAQRERVSVRLPPHFMDLRPGDLVELSPDGRRWTVTQLTFEAITVIAELQSVWQSAPIVIADPGRSMPGVDIVSGPTQLALLDLPDLGSGALLGLQLAAASSTGTWRQVPVEVSMGATLSGGTSAAAETVMGRALSVLAPAQARLLDLASSVDVELANDGQWLESCDEDALLRGANLAVLGRELFQFGSAVAIGPKRFRLSRLLRGRSATEWAMERHEAGEGLVMLDSRRLRPIAIPDSLANTTVTATAYGIGDAAGTSVSEIASGEALRPPSPVHLRTRMSDGGLEARWVRRSRTGYAWSDDIDAPLGETAERYRVRIEGTAANVELETDTSSVALTSAELAPAGSGPATLNVAQIGDRALSRWSAIPINL